MLVLAATAAAVAHTGARFVMCFNWRMTKVDETLYWLSIFADWTKSRGAESYHPMFWKLHFEPRGGMHWRKAVQFVGLSQA